MGSASKAAGPVISKSLQVLDKQFLGVSEHHWGQRGGGREGGRVKGI